MASNIQTHPGFKRYTIPTDTLNNQRDVYVKIGGKTCVISNTESILQKNQTGGERIRIDKPYTYWLWVDCRDITAKQADARLRAARNLLKRILTNKRKVFVMGHGREVSINVRAPYLSIVVEQTPELLDGFQKVRAYGEKKLSDLNDDDYVQQEFQRLRAINTDDVTDEALIRQIKYIVEQKSNNIKYTIATICKNPYEAFVPPSTEPVPCIPATTYKPAEIPKETKPVVNDRMNDTTTIPEWAEELSQVADGDEEMLSSITSQVCDLITTIKESDADPQRLDSDLAVDILKDLMVAIASKQSSDCKKHVEEVCDRITTND